MLRELEVHGYVTISREYLDKEKNGVISQSSVITALLKQLLHTKASRRKGYFIAITKLNSIGNGTVEEKTQDIIFPLSISCKTFLPVKGEIMLGIVYQVAARGVFLRSGPMNIIIYLSARKMPTFHYLNLGSQGFFISDDLSRIQNDVVVCFEVFATRWGNPHLGVEGKREFTILASLEGDCLGPVSLPGNDEL